LPRNSQSVTVVVTPWSFTAPWFHDQFRSNTQFRIIGDAS
jgi:hypothetical protein